MRLRTQSVSQLLALYAAIVEELRLRGVTRSSNNPVADYTKFLCRRHLHSIQQKNQQKVSTQLTRAVLVIRLRGVA